MQENKAPFFSKISHELRTPIHGIKGLSNFLVENWDSIDDDTRKKCAREILKSSEVLNNLIDVFIQISKENIKSFQFNFTKSDLLKAVKKAIDETSVFESYKNFKIQLTCPFKECMSNIDVFWFKQLMTNLLSNAINYSDKGTIFVNITSKKIKEVEYYLISVKDEGLGIPESELKNIFKAFNQGTRENSKSGGVGLGLTICKEIVEAHGGKIWAENNNDIGAKIEFTIPIN